MRDQAVLGRKSVAAWWWWREERGEAGELSSRQVITVTSYCSQAKDRQDCQGWEGEVKLMRSLILLQQIYVC